MVTFGNMQLQVVTGVIVMGESKGRERISEIQRIGDNRKTYVDWRLKKRRFISELLNRDSIGQVKIICLALYLYF